MPCMEVVIHNPTGTLYFAKQLPSKKYFAKIFCEDKTKVNLNITVDFTVASVV